MLTLLISSRPKASGSPSQVYFHRLRVNEVHLDCGSAASKLDSYYLRVKLVRFQDVH